MVQEAVGVIRINGLTDEDPDDPIVWEKYVEHVDGNELVLRHVFIRKSQAELMVSQIGQEAFDEYLEDCGRKFDKRDIH